MGHGPCSSYVIPLWLGNIGVVHSLDERKASGLMDG